MQKQQDQQAKPQVNSLSAPDYEKINFYIKEFLKFNKYQSTLECFEAEERTKMVTSKKKQINIHPSEVPSSRTQSNNL